jgi:hypothetical protein
MFGVKCCFFCSDPCDPNNSAICIRCGALICISTRIGGAGCIGSRTLTVDRSLFECPVCIGSPKTHTSLLPYYLAGSGLRRTPKIPWPVLLVGIQLKNLDSLVLKLLSATAESNYILDREHVRFTVKLLPAPLTFLQLHFNHVDMKKGGGNLILKHSYDHINFIRKSISDGRPANLIVVLDTHSDTFTGQLQTTGGLTGVGTNLSLPDLVRSYVGDAALQEMRHASAVARSYPSCLEMSPGVAPWADITPKARGGWRVMVMVSCGSAVRIPVHWDYITQLFTQ